MRILGDLAAVTPARDTGGTGLTQVMHDVADRVHHRGLMVVLSDFLTDLDRLAKALHHLRFRGHDVILFQVLDWSEVEFPFDDLTRFEDPESGDTVIAQPQAVRSRYLDALRGFTQRCRDEASAVRADFVQVHTGMGFDRALVQFLIDRQRRY
jgi:hypothetical protein